MTAYYLRFLPKYSDTTAPLCAVLRCTLEPLLKSQLTSPPVLAHFDLLCPTFVTCDASNTAVGAVLSQFQHGTEHPVAFASKSLTQAEQKYLVGEREALACVWAAMAHVFVWAAFHAVD